MTSRMSTMLTNSSRNSEDARTKSLPSNISFHHSLLSNSQSLDSQSLMILPLLLKKRPKPSVMQLLLLLTHTVRLLLMLQQPWLVQFRQIVTLWMHSMLSSSLTWMPELPSSLKNILRFSGRLLLISTALFPTMKDKDSSGKPSTRRMLSSQLSTPSETTLLNNSV